MSAAVAGPTSFRPTRSYTNPRDVTDFRATFDPKVLGSIPSGGIAAPGFGPVFLCPPRFDVLARPLLDGSAMVERW